MESHKFKKTELTPEQRAILVTQRKIRTSERKKNICGTIKEMGIAELFGWESEETGVWFKIDASLGVDIAKCLVESLREQADYFEEYYIKRRKDGKFPGRRYEDTTGDSGS